MDATPPDEPGIRRPGIAGRVASTSAGRHLDDSPRFDVLKPTTCSIRPHDLDPRNHGEITKSGVHAMILGGQIARVGPNPSRQSLIAEFDPHSGSDRRSAQAISNIDHQPVSTIRNHVQKKARRGPEVLNHDVLPAIVVEVREDRSSTGPSGRRCDTSGRRHDLKPASIAPEENVRLGIRIRGVSIVTRTDATIRGIEVKPSIIVEVDEPEPESREVPTRRTKAGPIRRIEKT